MKKKIFLAVLVMAFGHVQAQVKPVRRFFKTEEGQHFIRTQAYMGSVMWGVVLGYMLSSENNSRNSSLLGGMIGYFLMHTLFQSSRLRKLERLVDQQGKFIGSPEAEYCANGKRFVFGDYSLADATLQNVALFGFLCSQINEIREKKQDEISQKETESQT